MRTVVVAPYATLVRSAQEFPQRAYFAPHSHDHNHLWDCRGNGENLKSVWCLSASPRLLLRTAGSLF